MVKSFSFNDILEKYRKHSFSERDKGDRFERLMQSYLLTDPKYAHLFEKVWMWEKFPGKKDLGGNDTGIDLVALTVDGDYWAIQCKCFQAGAMIDKPAVDSFLATSSRDFTDHEYKTKRFSHRLWISTTNNWGKNATEAINNQNPPLTRINLFDLQDAPVDWEKLEKGIHGEESRTPTKTLRPHQKEAVEKTHEHFKSSHRGQLIMACGTGKTFASLRIAENETNGQGLILFLVPSIALMSQTLREWCADSMDPINAVCICSDPKVSRKKTKDEDRDTFGIVDLALPASTDVHNIVNQFRLLKNKKGKGLTVVFSTYQSIDVIAKAQKELLKENKRYGTFDLIVCDEAHRTTGVSLVGEDESAFIRVHDNKYLRSMKRLYMTATPRLYNDDSKSRAAQVDAVLCSMDDNKLYGTEIYRIGFGKAVEKDLLTDYKVLILTLSERDIPKTIQSMITDKSSEINTDDVSKLIGCVNALSKQILGDEGILKATDPEPMQRALAFCPTIIGSKKITSTFNLATDTYISSLPETTKEQMVSVESKHIDGGMNAAERDEKLGWLKADHDTNTCRIITNVRCLSEGVDVPSLDAVMFLSPRNSQVDVVQSVGRVMRKAPGKKYGYIIIPVVVPENVEADKALDDNARYKVVWTVLNALRAHDDRFNATVNKIELNKKKPGQILVGTPGHTVDGGADGIAIPKSENKIDSKLGKQIALQFEQLQNVMFAKMVQKVGDRRYWEQWAKSVGEIAERQVDRIHRMIKEDKTHRKAFEAFLEGLQKNINPSINKQEAVEMLSQHTITKPVFEALFEGYSFVKNNPISISMQTMLDLLETQAIEKDTTVLDKFYNSVRMRASDIDNAEGKQRIIVELYDKFFKTAFPKMVERLGIVYTPVEIVDFIIHSVNDVLRKEFNRSITDENIHILDPFTGTGTFITRLIQSGLIEKQDLARKYKNELHANEIVLLAYYIAAVNIENAYHDVIGEDAYTAFEGIVLTDTFQLGETDDNEKLFSEMFPKNSARVVKQKKAPLKVIIGNPPYSVGQKSANDNAQNQTYAILDKRIAETYAAVSTSGLNKSLYDAYIKAFRWSTDRLDQKNGGIICFVSNGSYLDGNTHDGFRKVLEKEFSSIYVFNLRGNQRTKGEVSRREGGKIFGSGSRAPISITLLVKSPAKNQQNANIYYYDIGDYLSQKEKLAIIKQYASITSDDIPISALNPNKFGDWLNQRSDTFSSLIPLASDKKFNIKSESFFNTHAIGVSTNRDAWVYNYSELMIQKNMKSMIAIYSKQMKQYVTKLKKHPKLKIDDFIDRNPKKIAWTVKLKKDFENLVAHKYGDKHFREVFYRPFTRQKLYLDKAFIERPGLNLKFFPNAQEPNYVICIPAPGGKTEMSVLIAGGIADLHLNGDSQCFPLYYYEERRKQSPNLFDSSGKDEFIRRDGVSDFILKRARKMYGKTVGKEDIFYYVYGIMHSPKYRKTFSSDLKKMLPRLPLLDDVRDFWKFSKAGRKLSDLHINYESVPAFDGVVVRGEKSKFFKVEKMRFPKKGEKGTILYNSKIALENIPVKAYEYIVNGKSAIEWIMERYQVTTHKASGIKNDPNDWAKEVGNPRYILDLLLSVINVSVQTVDIVNGLPKVKFE